MHRKVTFRSSERFREVVEKFQQLGADIKKVYDPEGELAESV